MVGTFGEDALTHQGLDAAKAHVPETMMPTKELFVGLGEVPICAIDDAYVVCQWLSEEWDLALAEGLTGR